MRYKIAKKLKKHLLEYKRPLRYPQYLLMLADEKGVICAVRKLKQTHGCEYAPGINNQVLTEEYMEAQRRKLNIAGIYIIPQKAYYTAGLTPFARRYYIINRKSLFNFNFPGACTTIMIHRTCFDISTHPMTAYYPKVK